MDSTQFSANPRVPCSREEGPLSGLRHPPKSHFAPFLPESVCLFSFSALLFADLLPLVHILRAMSGGGKNAFLSVQHGLLVKLWVRGGGGSGGEVAVGEGGAGWGGGGGGGPYGVIFDVFKEDLF